VDTVGCGGTRGEGNGRGGRAEEVGGVMGGVKKHELCFVEVDQEAGEGEPRVDPVPGGGDLSGGGRKGRARGEDAAIVNIEGEVLGIPKGRSVKEWSGKKSREDRGKGRALRCALVNPKGFRRVAVEAESEGTVRHEAVNP